MKISISNPPNIEEIKKVFNLEGQHVVFTFGDVIYNPENLPISDNLFEHEKIHGIQQQHDSTLANLWWQRYLQDVEFRIDQEVEAYTAQYKYICKRIKDRNKRFRILNDIAGYLSGPIYGRSISKGDALQRLYNKVK